KSHLGEGVKSLDERTSHGALDVVLGDNLELVEHGSFDETRVLLDGVGSPTGVDRDGEFTVLLGEEFLEGRGHLGVEHLDGRLDSPVTGLLLELAVSHLVVADGVQFDLGLAFLAGSDRLDLSHHTVGVSLVALVGLDVLVEGSTTLLLILDVLLVILSLEVLLVVLLVESVHLGFLHSRVLVEILEPGLDDVLLGSLLSLLEVDLDVVLSDEKGGGDSLGSSFVDVSMDVSLNVQLDAGSLLKVGRTDFVHKSLELLDVDGLVLGLDVGASLLGPDTNEGDGAGLELDETAGLLGKGEGGLDLELLVPVHLSGHLEGHVHIDRVEKLDSERDKRVLHFGLGDVSGSESGTGLKTETESID
ncbi:hypothetical protein PFISCL1PPCAC_15774, partial [Pristionchus fissidentatus]